MVCSVLDLCSLFYLQMSPPTATCTIFSRQLNVFEPPRLGQVIMYEVPFFTPEECNTVAEAAVATTAIPGFVPARSRFDPETEVSLEDLSLEVLHIVLYCNRRRKMDSQFPQNTKPSVRVYGNSGYPRRRCRCRDNAQSLKNPTPVNRFLAPCNSPACFSVCPTGFLHTRITFLGHVSVLFLPEVLWGRVAHWFH